MRDVAESPEGLRSALFVDFDNAYNQLKKKDVVAADQFARLPGLWVRWMESEMDLPPTVTAGKRRLLLRRCYMNPKEFADFRDPFTRAGFEVVDCPSLTKEGKSSADLRIAMDVLDAVDHQTRFDEFIILSSDSDFAPVLLRLRSHDRRTTILATTNTCAAYRSVSELTIDVADIIEFYRSQTDGSMDRPIRIETSVQPADRELFQRVAHRVYHEASISGRLNPPDVLSVYKKFPEFADSNWLGCYSLKRMTSAVVSARADLGLVGDEDWSVVVRSSEEALTSPSEIGDARHAQLKELIGKQVIELVARSEEPVTMVGAAYDLRLKYGSEIDGTNWAGAGTFKGLLLWLRLPNIELSSVPPGYIYDGVRHQPPQLQDRWNTLREKHPDLIAVIQLVHRTAGVPALSPETYRSLYRFIADEIDEDGYGLTRTSRAVRDKCLSHGLGASRQDCTVVLRGLVWSGVALRKGPGVNDPEELARMFCDHVLDICENTGLKLNDEERGKIQSWLGIAEDLGDRANSE